MNKNKNTLREIFPDMPENTYKTLMQTAHSVKENKIKRRPTMRTVLAAALIIISVTVLAYAVFTPNVASFFGQLYGKETEDWISQGAVATSEDNITLNGITFRMNEVVYRENSLLGLVSIVGEGAQESSIRIDKIGVDEGELLDVHVVGYDQVLQDDGSLLYSFEATDGIVISEGEAYILQMTVSANKGTQKWQVKVNPLSLAIQKEDSESPKTTLSSDKGDAESPKATLNSDKIEVIIPSEYIENGTLPIYKAIKRNFISSISPEWFNQSGVSKQEGYEVVYKDQAVLSLAEEALHYNTYEGTYNGNYKEPDLPAMTLPLPTLRNAIASLAGKVHFGWYYGEDVDYKDLKLKKTSLSGISLKEARAKMEELMAKLGMENYTNTWALDMDIDRILMIGEKNNQWIMRPGNPSNPPVMDYTKATQDDEGYFLIYETNIENNEGMYEASAYITKQGFAYVGIRDAYQKGEVYDAPDKLIDGETILATLPKAIANSRFSEMQASNIISMELTYTLARAPKVGEGMVFVPAWTIKYYDHPEESYEAYAVFNAVDGTLLHAIFK